MTPRDWQRLQIASDMIADAEPGSVIRFSDWEVSNDGSRDIHIAIKHRVALVLGEHIPATEATFDTSTLHEASADPPPALGVEQRAGRSVPAGRTRPVSAANADGSPVAETTA